MDRDITSGALSFTDDLSHVLLNIIADIKKKIWNGSLGVGLCIVFLWFILIHDSLDFPCDSFPWFILIIFQVWFILIHDGSLSPLGSSTWFIHFICVTLLCYTFFLKVWLFLMRDSFCYTTDPFSYVILWPDSFMLKCDSSALYIFFTRDCFCDPLWYTMDPFSATWFISIACKLPANINESFEGVTCKNALIIS